MPMVPDPPEEARIPPTGTASGSGDVPAPLGPLAPVEAIPGDEQQGPQEGVALCLSGGGSRAMLFHAGALLRLNELGALGSLQRVSSVSGGSITAGVLARAWSDLDFGADGRSPALQSLVVDPLRSLARQSIDIRAWLIGTLLPGSSPARQYAAALDRHLYHGARLGDLPDAPRFVFNSTNMASGVLWRFSKPYMADYLVGKVPRPEIPLSLAVAASGAFPPFFSPLRLPVELSAYEPGDYELGTAEYRRRPALGDGGIYDNLGLETAWKRYRTILVSDGGGILRPQPSPPGDLIFQTIRLTSLIDRQVRALRKRMLIDGYVAGIRQGTYWGIRSDITHYRAAGTLDCPEPLTTKLADVATRLTRLPDVTIDRLINWGYAIADAAMRSFVLRDADPPAAFPYPEVGVG